MDNDIRQNFIDDIEQRISELMRAHRGLSNVLLGQGFVVVAAHGSTMTFDVDPLGNVSNPQMCRPDKARRFGLQDARTVAAATHDGTHQPYRAVHVLEAIALELEQLGSVLSSLKAVAA